MSGVKDRYIEGDVDAQIVGDVVMWEDAANTIRPASATYPLPVAASSVPSSIQGPGNPTVDLYTSAPVSLLANTADQVLVAAPAAGHQIWVYGLFMMADTAAGTVTLQDSDNVSKSGLIAVSDEGGWVLPLSGNFAMPWIKVPTGKALEADTGACTVDGLIAYALVRV